jgi:hypothetical protein
MFVLYLIIVQLLEYKLWPVLLYGTWIILCLYVLLFNFSYIHVTRACILVACFSGSEGGWTQSVFILTFCGNSGS